MRKKIKKEMFLFHLFNTITIDSIIYIESNYKNTPFHFSQNQFIH